MIGEDKLPHFYSIGDETIDDVRHKYGDRSYEEVDRQFIGDVVLRDRVIDERLLEDERGKLVNRQKHYVCAKAADKDYDT